MIGGHEARVIGSHAKVAASVELQYRSNFWIYLVNALVTLGLSLSSIALVYRHVDQVGGWSSDDLLVVVGVFFALGAIVNGVVHSSMSKLVADIRHGDFDYRLLKPVDAQLVALAQQPEPWRVLDLVVGALVVAVGIGRGGFEQFGAGGLAGALAAAGVMFLCSVTIVASFWALLASMTFWTVQGEGILWALDDMYDHLRWPITIFPDGLRLALSTIFPAGLAVTVPALALTGRLDATAAASAVAMAAGLAAAARLVWRVAVRRYEGASA
ncbi:MAG: transporter permease [Thermoleophilia bacterium]|nr:transporter permease [Thermoleophilia bacterium]